MTNKKAMKLAWSVREAKENFIQVVAYYQARIDRNLSITKHFIICEYNVKSHTDATYRKDLLLMAKYIAKIHNDRLKRKEKA